MKPIVDIIPTAQAAAAIDFQDSITVVIDVLRATTSIQCIFESGGSRVFPVQTVEEARALKREIPEALLCGERKGVALDGFDMGNSPKDFLDVDLRNQSVILTTTNGTLAIKEAHASTRLFSGCMRNALSVGRLANSESEDRSIYIVCAGTEGAFSIEDFYCAGLVLTGLLEWGSATLTDFAHAARVLAAQPVHGVVNTATCKHLSYLEKIGFSQDVRIALEPERESGETAVPRYDRTRYCFVSNME